MKVYIVEGSQGEYSAHTSWLVCACLSQDKAQEIARKIEELQEYNRIHSEEMRKFLSTWDSENRLSNCPVRPIDVGSMKLERRSAKHNEVNKRNIFRYQEQMNSYMTERTEHSKKRDQAKKDWFAKTFQPPADLLEFNRYLEYNGDYASNASYSVLETELIDGDSYGQSNQEPGRAHHGFSGGGAVEVLG